jgi:glycerol-3-phosphate dehydrogenase
LRKLSQIVVPKLFDSENDYVFQNSDRRLIFASPYERDFTLIGTVGQLFKGDPAIVSVSVGEIAYLCHAANRYFRARVDPSDVVRTVAGANAAFDRDRKGAARDGDDLTGAKVRYLMTQQWARFPDDVLWRRSKLGLTMPARDRDAPAQFMPAEMIGH